MKKTSEQPRKRRKPKPSDERETPQEFFDGLNRQFQFNLDVAASVENAKVGQGEVKEFFTLQDDGLSRKWAPRKPKGAKGRVWCNPPYSDIPAWITKAHEEWAKGNCEFIVMLLPADTSTVWFHDLLLGGPHRLDFVYVRGRLKFRSDISTSAKFPSMLVIWRNQ